MKVKAEQFVDVTITGKMGEFTELGYHLLNMLDEFRPEDKPQIVIDFARQLNQALDEA